MWLSLAYATLVHAYAPHAPHLLSSRAHPAAATLHRPALDAPLVLMSVESPEPAASTGGEATWAPESEIAGDRSISSVSYASQFERLFSERTLQTSTPVAKPSNDAQSLEATARRVAFSDVYATLMRPPLSKSRAWTRTDYGRMAFFITLHSFGALAPIFYFSWRRLAVGFLLYVGTGMGITYSFHRQLAHRSFKSPKWLEYTAAYCGSMAMQVESPHFFSLFLNVAPPFLPYVRN